MDEDRMTQIALIMSLRTQPEATVYTLTQLSVGTFDINIDQNGVLMREISKLPSVATVTI